MKILSFSHSRLKLRLVGMGLSIIVSLSLLVACGDTPSPTAVPQAAVATTTPARVATSTVLPATPRKTIMPNTTIPETTAPATTASTITITTALPTIATSPIPSNANRAAQEDDIREMIFRYTFAHSVGGKVPKIYFLSLASTFHIKTEQKDPGDALLKRFAGESFTVKKISEATISNASPFAVKDKATGEDGLIYGVSDIKWISDTEAEVEGSYYMFGMNAGGTTYKIGLENGKWMIKGTGMVWIT